LLLSIFIYRLDDFSNLKHRNFWIYALIGGITNIAYVLAVINGELVRVMLLFFLSPVWTIPFSFLFLKEKLYLKNLLAASLSLFGAFIVLWQEGFSILSLNISDVYAIIGGIGFALTNVLARRFNKLSIKDKSYAIWIGVIIIALVSSILFPIELNSSSFDFRAILILILLGFILLFTTMAVQIGLTLVEAVRASPIFLFEIVVVGISGYLLANESLLVKDFIGGVFIILGVLISTRK
jgi:drug/metabolite transporter (DMT)-like permease